MARRRRRRGAISKAIGRYWGYLILFATIAAWLEKVAGPGWIAAGSGMSLLYMLFAAPTWCGAPNRDGTPCRNNARGLLLGCNQVRRHKWENLKMIFARQRWVGVVKRFWGHASNGAATIGALASATSACAAVVTLVIRR